MLQSVPMSLEDRQPRMLHRVVSAALVLATAALATSCTERAPEVQVVNHSFGRPHEVVMTHLDLDLTVDFDRERLGGTATIDIENKTGAGEVVLDTWELNITRVTLDDGSEAQYSLGEVVGTLGRPLVVPIHGDTKRLTVHYETTDGARALQWLSREQTRDKKHPFLLTQSQTIHARSWIPCQDAPGVRFTYSAQVRVPPGLVALMSARNGTEKAADGVYTFDMPQAIPAYLLALAVGDIVFRPLSERCGIYAEPSFADACAYEFADLERMMQVAEQLYGPYRWERYDAIVLPPSFPFGGMENPRLTFLTPTLIAGDRSLTSTLAHELAHSWSGNLVTNESWGDFWLNEGFTTYFERRIMEELYGRDVTEMHALLGVDDLKEEIDEFGDESDKTKLLRDLTGSDPDEELMTTPYEKGYLFLRLLEEAVGRERWDAFLREYFDTYAFRSMTTERFVEYMTRELYGGDDSQLRALHVDEWLNGTGLPNNAPQPRSGRFAAVDEQVAAWNTGAPAATLRVDGWSTQEWDHFLTHVDPEISAARLADLDATFDLAHRNAELQRSWFLLVIDNHWEPGLPAVEDYLRSVGRGWLIRPLYQKLSTTDWGRDYAARVYRETRPGYHSLTRSSIDRILEWSE